MWFAGESHALAGKHSWTNTVLDICISSASGKCCNRGHGFHIEKATDTGLDCCACAAYGLLRKCYYWRRMLLRCAYAWFLYYILRTPLCIAFLEKVKVHYKDCRWENGNIKPLVRILCKIKSFSTILFIYWWNNYWNEGKCILCRNAFLFFWYFCK